ncbi:protein kinase domain-containing protein [Acanthopleuribacter pedis]|uniref:Protein kinase n=1 Tax=Acanthopleuribacter pedis TaxID=442870 RepID=A0A8J7QL92_9BACT|nr:protein kinase [Acanthopleuribacter pedis]MBO1320035.1 protein kinase [Acanthopleuribacter pedis]
MQHTQDLDSIIDALREGLQTKIGKGFRVETILAVDHVATEVRLHDDLTGSQVSARIYPVEPAQFDEVEQLWKSDAIATATAQATHPSLAKCQGLRVFGNTIGVVSDYRPNVDLGRFLKHLGIAQEEFACRLMLQLTRAFVTLEGFGLGHDQLTPADVLMHSDGSILVKNYGLHAFEHSVATLCGVDALYSPEYRAPEQMDRLAGGPAGAMYQLGLIFYQMVTGRPPFVGGADAVRQAHRGTPPQDPRQWNTGLSEGLVRIILRLLAKNPEDRFSTFTELQRGLIALLPMGEGLAMMKEAGGPLRQLGDKELARVEAQLQAAREAAAGNDFDTGLQMVDSAFRMFGYQDTTYAAYEEIWSARHEILVRELLNTAQRQMSKRRPEEALKTLNKVISVQPRHQKAHEMMRNIFLWLGAEAPVFLGGLDAAAVTAAGEQAPAGSLQAFAHFGRVLVSDEAATGLDAAAFEPLKQTALDGLQRTVAGWEEGQAEGEAADTGGQALFEGDDDLFDQALDAQLDQRLRDTGGPTRFDEKFEGKAASPPADAADQPAAAPTAPVEPTPVPEPAVPEAVEVEQPENSYLGYDDDDIGAQDLVSVPTPEPEGDQVPATPPEPRNHLGFDEDDYLANQPDTAPVAPLAPAAVAKQADAEEKPAPIQDDAPGEDAVPAGLPPLVAEDDDLDADPSGYDLPEPDDSLNDSLGDFDGLDDVPEAAPLLGEKPLPPVDDFDADPFDAPRPAQTMKLKIDMEALGNGEQGLVADQTIEELEDPAPPPPAETPAAAETAPEAAPAPPAPKKKLPVALIGAVAAVLAMVLIGGGLYMSSRNAHLKAAEEAYQQANNLQQRGKWTEALAAWEAAAEAYPDYKDTQSRRDSIESDIIARDETLKKYLSAARDFIATGDLVGNMGDNATSYLKKAEALDPGNPDIQAVYDEMTRGEVAQILELMEGNQIKAAQERYQDLKAIVPNFSDPDIEQRLQLWLEEDLLGPGLKRLDQAIAASKWEDAMEISGDLEEVVPGSQKIAQRWQTVVDDYTLKVDQAREAGNQALMLRHLNVLVTIRPEDETLAETRNQLSRSLNQSRIDDLEASINKFTEQNKLAQACKIALNLRKLDSSNEVARQAVVSFRREKDDRIKALKQDNSRAALDVYEEILRVLNWRSYRNQQKELEKRVKAFDTQVAALKKSSADYDKMLASLDNTLNSFKDFAKDRHYATLRNNRAKFAREKDAFNSVIAWEKDARGKASVPYSDILDRLKKESFQLPYARQRMQTLIKRYDELVNNYSGGVTIVIRGAANLPREKSGFNRDPDGLVELVSGDTTCTTEAESNERNPVWDFVCNFSTTSNQKIEFNVYEKNSRRRDLIGTVSLDRLPNSTKGLELKHPDGWSLTIDIRRER